MNPQLEQASQVEPAVIKSEEGIGLVSKTNMKVASIVVEGKKHSNMTSLISKNTTSQHQRSTLRYPSVLANTEDPNNVLMMK